MKRKFAAIGLALLISSLSHAFTIKGIKVISSSFDPKTHTVRLIFINDTAKDITAYGMVVEEEFKTASGNVSKTIEGSATDFLRPWIQHQLDRSRRPWLPRDPGWGHPIHPGESTELTRVIQMPDLTNAAISIDVVVYSDGTAEYDNETSFRRIVVGRKQDLKAAQMALKAAQELRKTRAPRELLIAQLKDQSNNLPQPATQEDEDLTFLLRASISSIITEIDNPGIPDDGHFISTFIAEQQKAISMLEKGMDIRRNAQ